MPRYKLRDPGPYEGYIHQVPADVVKRSGDDQYFLPHFHITREDKQMTKVRFVFDAATTWDGWFITDRMYAGPALQTDLVDILICFSVQPVALVTDIAEMFLQVRLHDSDRRYHRFLWRNDDGWVAAFEFQRLVFGINASSISPARPSR